MNIEQYRKRWIRYHKQYEKIAYTVFIKSIRETANKIPFQFLTEDNYMLTIDKTITIDEILQAYFKVYSEVGLIHGERVGKSINKQIKEFTLRSFLSMFERTLLEWLFRNSSYRITSVKNTLTSYIQEILSFGIAEGKTISELATDLQTRINQRNFYRWQALRIARTETTAAANYASVVAADVSGVESEKVWVSSHDARTRQPPDSKFNHYVMDAVRVDYDKPFNVSGEMLEFPGDPKGSAGNVINCRCSAAVVPKRDSEGNIVIL